MASSDRDVEPQLPEVVPAALALRAIELAGELRHYAGDHFNARRGYEREISQLRATVEAAVAAGPGAVTEAFENLLASIWRYVDWRYVTRQLTTEQKNRFADAVDASHRRTAAGRPGSRRPTSSSIGSR
jgi:hypothetical protein